MVMMDYDQGVYKSRAHDQDYDHDYIHDNDGDDDFDEYDEDDVDGDDDDVNVVDTEHLAALATSGPCSSNYSSTFIPSLLLLFFF